MPCIGYKIWIFLSTGTSLERRHGHSGIDSHFHLSACGKLYRRGRDLGRIVGVRVGLGDCHVGMGTREKDEIIVPCRSVLHGQGHFIGCLAGRYSGPGVARHVHLVPACEGIIGTYGNLGDCLVRKVADSDLEQ